MSNLQQVFFLFYFPFVAFLNPTETAATKSWPASTRLAFLCNVMQLDLRINWRAMGAACGCVQSDDTQCEAWKVPRSVPVLSREGKEVRLLTFFSPTKATFEANMADASWISSPQGFDFICPEGGPTLAVGDSISRTITLPYWLTDATITRIERQTRDRYVLSLLPHIDTTAPH